MILTQIITQHILSYLHSLVSKVLAVLKKRKNICLNTKLVIKIFSFIHTRFIFAFSFAGSASSYVSHDQLDEHRVGELGMGIYFGILHHIHYKYIPVPHHVSRAFSCGGSNYPLLKNMKYNIREKRIFIHITQCLYIYLLRFIY